MNLTGIQRKVAGLDETGLVAFEDSSRNVMLHREVVEPFRLLQQDAREAGFTLGIVSAYRSFDRQIAIWNGKASGKRDLLDDDGRVLDPSLLSDAEKLHAILRWSAIPGVSRHHWENDLDIYDAAVVPLVDVQLTQFEVVDGGVFFPLHEWLGEKIVRNESRGFYRPFAVDQGGVAQELWHLSYLPLAVQYAPVAERESLLSLWKEHDLALLEALVPELDTVWNRYVAQSLDGQPDWVVRAFSG